MKLDAIKPIGREEEEKKPSQFPTLLGAAVPIYNLSGTKQPTLRFTPQALSGIYLGTIKKWNDPAIAETNPEAKLTSADIVVIHRVGASGTNYVWTDYLSKASAESRAKIGKGTEVSWPVGEGVRGSAALAEKVVHTTYSIG